MSSDLCVLGPWDARFDASLCIIDGVATTEVGNEKVLHGRVNGPKLWLPESVDSGNGSRVPKD